MSQLKEQGRFGPVLAVDYADGSRKYHELEPDQLRQLKNDIRDGKVEGAIRFNQLAPVRGKSPDWRCRIFANAEAKSQPEPPAEDPAEAEEPQPEPPAEDPAEAEEPVPPKRKKK